MARGAEAKANVVKKLQEAFGADFVGEYDKKVYVWSKENGEKIQIAISMTCPKTPVGAVNPASLDFGGDLDFENMGAPVVAQANFEPAEISEEEKQTVADLMAKLGL
jgi:hypothetical protein